MSSIDEPPAPPVTAVRSGAILMVAINRPQVLNAIDGETAALLVDAWDELDRDADLRVGVLAGGSRAFSTGMDMKAYASGSSPLVTGRGFAGLTERPPDKPLIAAVEGYALGGGFEMVLACDLVVAARTAEFGLPEVTRGLIASAGGLLRLPQQIPYRLAMKLALTGDRLSAEDAFAHGLLAELVEPGHALSAALAVAERIAANGPLAVRVSKHSINSGAGALTAEMWTAQAALERQVLGSQDAAEGVAAFRAKRPPRWTGR